jgi:hypothetical protein
VALDFLGEIHIFVGVPGETEVGVEMINVTKHVTQQQNLQHTESLPTSSSHRLSLWFGFAKGHQPVTLEEILRDTLSQVIEWQKYDKVYSTTCAYMDMG